MATFDNFKLIFVEKECDIGEYILKIPCKTTIKLHNPCPSENIALKIPKCFKLGKTTFCINGSITMKYQTLDVTHSTVCTKAAYVNGYYFLSINSSSSEKKNIICLHDICIPVEIFCANPSITQQTIKASAFMKTANVK